ncbi:YmaF family protein [Bacillus salipaludis]|uniref:YmaF family protein n=1 Tax=Bacillus salipaludis TaxID=2547811 RepID=A0ABW8RIJ4_9BACI
MQIPITGFIYESNDDSLNGDHSHVLYVTSLDGRRVHIHGFGGFTSFDAGHRHDYLGRTEPAPSGIPHVHRYFTITSFFDGHEHQIEGTTGPAIDIPSGGHYHEFKGTTTINGFHPHKHMYSGKTGNEV